MEAASWETAMQELVFSAVDQAILEISVGDTLLEVEAACSLTTRMAGLAERDEMPQDGMLFMYDEDVQKGYHRTDMRFPIAIRFYDSAGELVHVDMDSTIVKPLVAYRYVLETHADLELEGTLSIHGLA